jgi:biopolymer transport protein ExbB
MIMLFASAGLAIGVGVTASAIAAQSPDLFQALNIQLDTLHDAVFFVLYAMAIVATFLAVERLIFLWLAQRNASRLEHYLKPGTETFDGVPKNLLNSKLPAALALAEIRARVPYIHERGDLEDATDTAFIHAKRHLNQHIWILDTIITAAPLLGLLGTILGIIETFKTLAESGISDPSAVSRGIGVALFATAIGIATALYALLLHNVFQAMLSRILDIIKIILMRVGFVQNGTNSAR